MSASEPSWELYGTFLAVMREGSLSGASRALGLAQPTVRRRIEELEGGLDAVLFTRASNGLVPTEAAHAMLPHAEAMAASAVAVVSTLSAPANEVRGTVRIRSRDPLEAPAMQPNYLTREADCRCAVEAIKFARRLADAPALKGFLSEEYRPGPGAKRDDELLEFARNFGATIFHPAGTCRMGSDPLAVVDQRLRVHGLGSDLEVSGPDGARLLRERQHEGARPWLEIAGTLEPVARVQAEPHAIVMRRHAVSVCAVPVLGGTSAIVCTLSRSPASSTSPAAV